MHIPKLEAKNFGGIFTLTLKSKFYAKSLTVISSLAGVSHLQHGLFQTIYFNLEISFGSQNVQVSPFSCLLINFRKVILGFEKEDSFFYSFSHVLNA